MSNFKIKAYTKKELACLYFPDSNPRSATNHLMSWVRTDSELSKALEQMGYRKQDKCFTPREVRAIVEEFGEP